MKGFLSGRAGSAKAVRESHAASEGVLFGCLRGARFDRDVDCELTGPLEAEGDRERSPRLDSIG